MPPGKIVFSFYLNLHDWKRINKDCLCLIKADGNGGTYQEAFTITVTDVAENSFLLWTR